jgi:signal transduction histidine kinase
LATQVARSGEDMMRIINDILDVSKIEAGRLELDACDFTIRDTIEQACSVGQLEASAKGSGARAANRRGGPAARPRR